MSATVTVRYADSVAILDIAGRLTIAEGVGAMRDAIRQEINSGYKFLLLNLAGVNYMDSAALAEMSSAYIQVTGKGGKLRLVSAQQRIRDLLKVTRLSTLLVNYESETAALTGFGPR